MKSYYLGDHDIVTGSARYVLRIKDLADADKPRERLAREGAAALRIPELLAILLSPGSRKEGVLEMANRLISDYGPTPRWAKQKPEELARELDIPTTKACQLIAALELGNRLYSPKKVLTLGIRTPDQAFAHLRAMSQLQKEHFRGLYLNSRYFLIHEETISIGSLTSSLVHPREVFRPALERGAAAVIIAHNHPSGLLKATEDDFLVTQQLSKAGEILGIELLDHLIIGKDRYISLIKNGKI